MSSEIAADPVIDKANKVVETSPSKAPSSKKNRGKVPKKIHKAEREKIKREHLNELFLDLANALEISEPNSGRATVLNEAIRIVKDTLGQIECLRRENAALLSESQYVTTETKELQDDNSALQTQIGQLQTELKQRVSQPELDLNFAPSECGAQDSTSHYAGDRLTLPASGPSLRHAHIMNPMYVIPFQPQPQVNQDLDAAQISPKPVSVVSKPHPRYPTSDDTWPFRLLEKQPELGKGFQCRGSNSN